MDGDVGEVFLVGEIDFGDEGTFALDGIFELADPPLFDEVSLAELVEPRCCS